MSKHPKEKLKYKEGFWFGGSSNKFYPKPIGSEKSWIGKRDFLTALSKVENLKETKSNHYRGFSCCRLCQCNNGSAEYKNGDWVWPSGFAHYVSEHNVRPSYAFQQFILYIAGCVQPGIDPDAEDDDNK